MHLRLVCHGEVQHKALNVMGPLSRVWSTLEDAIAFEENQQEISLEEMVYLWYIGLPGALLSPSSKK